MSRKLVAGIVVTLMVGFLGAPGGAISGIGDDDDLDTNPPRCRRVAGTPLGVEGHATDDLDFDTGIFSVELAAGAVNVTLEVDDSFDQGDSEADFTVTRTDPEASGHGVVEVTDFEGFVCTVAADFLDVPAGPLVDFEICTDDGNRLVISNELRTPAGPSACSSNLYTFGEPGLPPGYEPLPESAVLTIDSPVFGETDMVLTIDVPFDPRLRLLLSRAEPEGVASFGGNQQFFQDFSNVTIKIESGSGQNQSILIGSGRWSPVKVTFALQSEICNGLDDDGDELVDEGLPVDDPSVDADDDAFPLCPAEGTDPDCDDQQAFIYPGAQEICNGLDDDCDGEIDDDCTDAGGSYVSVSTTQFLGSTLRQQDAYVLPASGAPIEPLVESFLPVSVGLDALDVVPGGDLLFSVRTSGGVQHAGGFTVLRQDRIYRYSRTNGAITTVVDWDDHGLPIGSLDALDRLDDDSFAFSTEVVRGVTHAGGYIVLRPENVYRFDPSAGTLELLFDGKALGLPDVDGVDILSDTADRGSLRLAFSVATDRLVFTPTGALMLRQQNAYTFDAGDGSLTLALDGQAAGLQSLDAFSLAGAEP